jgi:hypothetical protein
MRQIFNGPLRRSECPHPFRMTVYVLTEALKMMRVVAAQVRLFLCFKASFVGRR